MRSAFGSNLRAGASGARSAFGECVAQFIELAALVQAQRGLFSLRGAIPVTAPRQADGLPASTAQPRCAWWVHAETTRTVDHAASVRDKPP